MMSGASFRGQPLFALFAVLGCWVALRAALWDADALAPVSLPEMDVPARFADEPLGGNKPDRSVAHGGEQGGRLKRDSGAGDRPARRDRSFRIAPGAAAWPRSASDLRRPARRFLSECRPAPSALPRQI